MHRPVPITGFTSYTSVPLKASNEKGDGASQRHLSGHLAKIVRQSKYYRPKQGCQSPSSPRRPLRCRGIAQSVQSNCSRNAAGHGGVRYRTRSGIGRLRWAYNPACFAVGNESASTCLRNDCSFATDRRGWADFVGSPDVEVQPTHTSSSTITGKRPCSLKYRREKPLHGKGGAFGDGRNFPENTRVPRCSCFWQQTVLDRFDGNGALGRSRRGFSIHSVTVFGFFGGEGPNRAAIPVLGSSFLAGWMEGGTTRT